MRNRWNDTDGLALRPENWKGKLLCSLIPETPCDDNCSACCDIGLCFSVCYESHPYLEYCGYITNLQDNVCIMLDNGKCKIFGNRKLVCRLFGKTEGDLPCFKGLKPKILLTQEELRRIVWCASYGTLQDAFALKAWLLSK